MTTETKYKTFLILGLISFIDIATQKLLPPYIPNTTLGTLSASFGTLSTIIGLPVAYLFGSQMGALAMSLTHTLTGFSLIYFLVALFYRGKLKNEKQ